jgi:hypothetical protein
MPENFTHDTFSSEQYYYDEQARKHPTTVAVKSKLPKAKVTSSGLKVGDSLFHHGITWNVRTEEIYTPIYNDLPLAGKYHVDFAKQFTYNRFSPRHGHWAQPYPVIPLPELAMPSFDPNHNKTWTECTDERAQWVKALLEKESNRKIALYYSGGIDSLVVLIALLKALDTKELRSRLTICCSMESVIEYPVFFEKEVLGKFRIIDLKMGTVRFNNLINEGYTVITADLGDAMFGTEVSTQFYYTFRNHAERLGFQGRKMVSDLLEDIGKPDAHYSVYKDVLIAYLETPNVYSMPTKSRENILTPGFGEWYYNKLDKLAQTSDYTVHSLHDFFWQIIFNVKWMHCSCRCFMFFGDHTNNKPLFEHKRYINWFQSDDYQRWSMVNNNTGQKIKGVTASTYKWAAREYIYDYTKDEWALYFKLKIASFQKIAPVHSYPHAMDIIDRFALNTDYTVVRHSDPGVIDYIHHHLFNYNDLL